MAPLPEVPYFETRHFFLLFLFLAAGVAYPALRAASYDPVVALAYE